jgi:hypothetical protein
MAMILAPAATVRSTTIIMTTVPMGTAVNIMPTGIAVPAAIAMTIRTITMIIMARIITMIMERITLFC